MSKIIALLSGKGGSGKTTLALSIADLLRRCGIQTLVIDCDLSTNGATYFLEKRLANQFQSSGGQLLSFRDSIESKNSGYPVPLTVNTHFDFLASIWPIKVKDSKNLSAFDSLEANMKYLMNWAQAAYDVILLDCQAGYTDLLPSLLPHVDMELYVLEPDAVSAAAMINLLQKSQQYSKPKQYQVFNKANAEEFEVYSKVDATPLQNIGTLLFDWKIRKAFNLYRLPDLDHTSAKYGTDLCEICEVLLPEYHDKLEQFPRNRKRIELEETLAEEEDRLEEISAELENISHLSLYYFFRRFVIPVCMIFSIGALVLFTKAFLSSAFYYRNYPLPVSLLDAFRETMLLPALVMISFVGGFASLLFYNPRKGRGALVAQREQQRRKIRELKAQLNDLNRRNKRGRDKIPSEK